MLLILTVLSLNWTFMELKCHTLHDRTQDKASFELNLYGIEISKTTYFTTLTMSVWIEPLWNWNKRSAKSCCVMPLVWIEPLWNWNCTIQFDIIFGRAVWIEPLWNWNLRKTYITVSYNLFELNLYGIEIEI